MVLALLEASDHSRENHFGQGGTTTLWNAAVRGNLTVLTALLDAGVSPNIRNLPNSRDSRSKEFQALPNRILPQSRLKAIGTSALHGAANQNQANAIRILVEAGADPDPRDWFGSTPLLIAMRNGESKAAAALLDAGASLSTMNQFGQTPADFAPEEPMVDPPPATPPELTSEFVVVQLGSTGGAVRI